MSIYQSNVTDRTLYANAQNAMIAAGISATAYANAVKTQCFLRLIQPITTGAQIINFPVLQNQTGSGNATRADEVRLPQQNAFFVGQFQFKTFKLAAPGTNWVPNTYPNSITYTNAANLFGLYTGRLQVTIDQSVIARAYSMQKFLQIPQTQLTGATNSPEDQFDGTWMMPWEPNVVLVGTAQIDWNIVLPTALGTIDANTFGVWELYGIEAQNVALGAIQ